MTHKHGYIHPEILVDTSWVMDNLNNPDIRLVEDFWTIDEMGAALANGVQQEVLNRLVAQGVDQVETNVIYAVTRSKRS